jgi:DNA ligase-1
VLKGFQPMLACPGLPRVYPKLASYKLDGFRMVIMDGKAYSRSLELLPSPDVQRLFGRPELEGLDGELILGSPVVPGSLTRTGSFATTKRPQSRWEELTFFVFDKIEQGKPFVHRQQEAVEIVRRAKNKQVVALDHRLVHNWDELQTMENEAHAAGFEGLIARAPNSWYKFGRATASEESMLKIKRHEDSEARVIGVIEMMRNDNIAVVNGVGRTKRSTAKSGKTPKGTMGSLLVVDLATGVEFKIGTGFNAKQRVQWWENRDKVKGLIVKYRHTAVGAKDKPREGSFIGIRSPLDM